MKPFVVAFSVLALFSTSCTGNRTSEKEGFTDAKNKTIYADGFSIAEKEIIIKEPWPGASQPFVFPITEQPQTVVVTATTHLPFLELLDEGERLVGFPGIQYIYSPYFRERAESGLLKDLGPDSQLNLELLLDLEPDLVIAFDMGGESAMLDKIKQAGIPLLYNSDYLEASILGRAEWIKVFGALFGKEQLADSIFQVIEDNYFTISQLTETIDDRPTVFSGIMYGETWFLPGGKNGVAKLIEDAGGEYLWSQSTENGWLELSFESVYDKAGNADIWLGVGTINSYEALTGLDQRYESFAAFLSGNVYNYSKRISPGGGYDYFESGYARPDLILGDMMAIFHPQLLPDHEFTYFKPLD